jgi:hypothetical protein
MLDDKRKSLIEAEEEYRHKISQKLKAEVQSIEQSVKGAEKDFWGKASDILNSNFGLWFLSSVFISGGAALYQITQHHYLEKLNTQKELIICEFEIANRLNAMKFLLQKAKTYGEAQAALTPITKSFGAVSSAYEHVNIAALYFKTYQLTGEMHIDIANKVKDLEEMNLAIQAANPKTPFSDPDRNKLLALVADLQRFEMEEIHKRRN